MKVDIFPKIAPSRKLKNDQKILSRRIQTYQNIALVLLSKIEKEAILRSPERTRDYLSQRSSRNTYKHRARVQRIADGRSINFALKSPAQERGAYFTAPLPELASQG